MFIPTGITFIVHLLIVLVKKIGKFFGFDKIRQNSKPCGPVTQKIFSIFIIALVAVYIGWACTYFVGRGLSDRRATWK
ncbi:MAG: hypothetical protein RL641_300, partial [Candidatus Parcubacteria bacterium]